MSPDYRKEIAARTPLVQEPFRTYPPPEIYREMSIAGDAYDQLERIGFHVRFDADSRARRVRVEVEDLFGNPLFTVSPSDALEIAAGFVLSKPMSAWKRA